jgi:hypothetical protein
MPKKSHTHPMTTNSGTSRKRPAKANGVKPKKPSRTQRAAVAPALAKKASSGRQAQTQQRRVTPNKAQKSQRLLATRLEAIKTEKSAPDKPAKRAAVGQGKIAEVALPQVRDAEPTSSLRPPWTAVGPFAMLLRQQAFAFKLMLDVMQAQRQLISRAFHQ